MGVRDYLQNGVGQMTVARPAVGRNHVACPYRLGAPPVFSQLLVEGTEAAVFVRTGTILGVLGPGRHSLSATGTPFLEQCKSSDGDRYECEVIFVTTSSTRLSLDGSIGQLTDSSGNLAEFFLMGTVTVTTSNPAAVVAQGIGVGEPGAPFDHIVVTQVMRSIAKRLPYVFEHGLASPHDLSTVGPALLREGRSDQLGLVQTGLEITSLEITRLVSPQNRPPAGVEASSRRAEVAAADDLPKHQTCRFGAARMPVWDTEFEMQVHVSAVGYFEGEHVPSEHEQWMVDTIKQTLKQALTTWTGTVLDLPQKKDEWGRYVTQVVAPQLAHRAGLRGRVIIEGVEIDRQEAQELKRRRGAKLGGPSF